VPKQWMTEAESRAYLESRGEGRLATCDADGQPYITPLHYVVAGGAVYFHSARQGRKLANIAVNPKICFEVSHAGKSVFSDKACNCATRFESVLVSGRAELVTDLAEKVRALNALTTKNAVEKPFEAVDAARAESCAVVRITIDTVTGKRNVDPSQ